MEDKKKSLIGGIQKFSTEDGPGIRTTVFFKGCPINCKWCHNPDLISYHPEILHSPDKCIGCGACVKACPNHAITTDHTGIHIHRNLCQHCGTCTQTCYTDALRLSGKCWELQDIVGELMTDKSFYQKTGGGVTLSGGEVTSHTAYAYEIVQDCNQKKIGVAIDTCGYCQYEDLEKLARDAAYILYDLKCIDSVQHKELTGVGNEPIIENLKRLSEDSALKEKVIIRMPLVHPVNDKLEYMVETCALLKKLGFKTVNGIPYHNLGTSKSRSMGIEPVEFKTPSDAHLDAIKSIFEENGISFTIMGKDD